MDTYDKYLYYKTQYLELKQNGGNNDNKRKYDFYLFHSISDPVVTKVMGILNHGYIKLGSDVKKKT